jgi:AcrR family transcriptional regulator
MSFYLVTQNWRWEARRYAVSARPQAPRRGAPRARVLESATALFLSKGFVATTIADIAQHASVALLTIYRGFGSKAGLLSAVQDQAVVGDDEQIAQLDREWARGLADLSPRDAICVLVAELVPSAARAAPIFDVIQSAAADPAVRELLDETHRRRVQTCQELAHRVLGERSARSRQLGDLIYVVLGVESYLLLVVRRAWSEPKWAAWAQRALEAELSNGTAGNQDKEGRQCQPTARSVH